MAEPSALPLLGLLGLIAALYWPVVQFPFVNWDDPWYVIDNPLVKSWHPANLWRVATESVARNYAPLTIVSFLADHTFFGLNAGGYHAINVALHMCNAVLVFQLVSRLTGHRSLGLVTAGLFAVHPVQVESVAWISSRKTLLSATLTLASLQCWLRPARTHRDELWGTGFLILGLLAKASAVVIPPIVVVYDMLVARRKLAESLPRQIAPSFFCILLINLTMSSQTQMVGGIRSHIGISKMQLLGVDAVILWRYVGMLIAPVRLSILYDQPIDGINGQMTLSLLLWLGVAWMCWRIRRRFPLVTFAAAAWLLLLLPMLNLFPLTTLMNDRYLYLPCVCVFGMLASCSAALWTMLVQDRSGSQRAWTAFGSATTCLIVAALLSAYGVATRQRLEVWRSDFALWNDAVQATPQLGVVQIQWADALHRQGRTTEAVEALHTALEQCQPDAADCERINRRLRAWQ